MRLLLVSFPTENNEAAPSSARSKAKAASASKVVSFPKTKPRRTGGKVIILAPETPPKNGRRAAGA